MATREELNFTCNKCGQTKPSGEFHKARKNIGVHKWLCKECSARYSSGYYTKHQKEKNRQVKVHDKTDIARYGRLKSNAKKRGTEFNLDKLDFLIWFQGSEKTCHYCGVALNTNGHREEQISVDRMDNSQGYVIENMVLCCQQCNTIKGNIFTENEMIEIADKYLKPKMEACSG